LTSDRNGITESELVVLCNVWDLSRALLYPIITGISNTSHLAWALLSQKVNSLHHDRDLLKKKSISPSQVNCQGMKLTFHYMTNLAIQGLEGFKINARPFVCGEYKIDRTTKISG